MNFRKNLAVSHNFETAIKMVFKIGKYYAYCKKTILVLILNFSEMFIDILKRINYNDEYQVINC